MFSLNQATIIGRVGKPPEVRKLNNGGSVCNFSVATDNGYKDKATGDWKSKTEWHNVVVWNDHFIEQIEKRLNKGDLIGVVGSLETRKWQDASGNDRYMTELVVGRFAGQIVFIGGTAKPEDGHDRAMDEPRGKTTVTSGKAKQPALLDDDIPF